jgi:hypothetical protein
MVLGAISGSLRSLRMCALELGERSAPAQLIRLRCDIR